MAAGTDRWPGRRVHYWLFAIWSTVAIGACVKQQFSRSSIPLDGLAFALAWTAVYVLLAAVTPLVAAFRGSGSAGIRAYFESIAFLFVTIGAVWCVPGIFHGLGLGRWPPRDVVYARRFSERRADWTAERDRILGEARAAAAEPARGAAPRIGTGRFAHHCASDERTRELGAGLFLVADDASWIKFILYEGEFDLDPIEEKGLLFAAPELLSSSDASWVHDLAVENLGDGWFVYEE